MKIGFIGIGKLGKEAAEVMAVKHDVLGYDINEVHSDLFTTVLLMGKKNGPSSCSFNLFWS